MTASVNASNADADTERLVQFVKKHPKYEGQRYIVLHFLHQRRVVDNDCKTRVFAASYDLGEQTISARATGANRLVFTVHGAMHVSTTTTSSMVFDRDRKRDAYTTSTATRCFSSIGEWCDAIFDAIPGIRPRNVLAAVYWPEISKQISIADMAPKPQRQPAPAAVAVAALPPRPPPPLPRECVAYDTVTALLDILNRPSSSASASAKRKRFSSHDADAKRIARAHQKAAELVKLYTDDVDADAPVDAAVLVPVTSVPPKTFVRDVDTIVSTRDVWL